MLREGLFCIVYGESVFSYKSVQQTIESIGFLFACKIKYYIQKYLLFGNIGMIFWEKLLSVKDSIYSIQFFVLNLSIIFVFYEYKIPQKFVFLSEIGNFWVYLKLVW